MVSKYNTMIAIAWAKRALPESKQYHPAKAQKIYDRYHKIIDSLMSWHESTKKEQRIEKLKELFGFYN